MADGEQNSFLGRTARVARVGAGLSSAATAYGFNRVFGGDEADSKSARALRSALGGIKGPLMKVAQILATIPDLVPPEYAEELSQLQAHAPPMGWSFVKRRMRTELGPGWRDTFLDFEQEAAHAASLGQVHRATLHDGRKVACKLQYPDMQSAVEADLGQLRLALGLFKRMERSIDVSEVEHEIAARLREELDYERERKAMALYQMMLDEVETVRVPDPVESHSTSRLLTMTWVQGRRVLDFKTADQDTRNRIASALFAAWWKPMGAYGVIHGDPHLGNYTVAEDDGRVINLLDFGCIRIFPPRFVEGVIKLYRALKANDEDAERDAYANWGFHELTQGQREALNVWARFIYGPLLDDRERTVADGVSPGEYGRKEAFQVRELLKERGPVRVPREFVFMDRAAIGLGAVFLHLDAKLNFCRLFQDSIDGFDVDTVGQRQAEALSAVRLSAD